MTPAAITSLRERSMAQKPLISLTSAAQPNAAATNFARLLDETGWGIDAGNQTHLTYVIEPNGLLCIDARCPGSTSTFATAIN